MQTDLKQTTFYHLKASQLEELARRLFGRDISWRIIDDMEWKANNKIASAIGK